MINLKNVEFLYSPKKGIKNINLTFKKNNIYALLGHNGAGKSTLISIITGLNTPTKGSIDFDGLTYDKNSLDIKKMYYFVHDNPELTLNLTSIDFIQLMFSIYEKEFNEKTLEQLDNYLELFEIKDLINVNTNEMSHGQKQKISLICAFLIDTPILILDEPLVGLDTYSQVKLMELISQQKDKIVIFSSHDLVKTQKYVKDLILVAQSQILYQGKIEEFLTSYASYGSSLEDIYLGLYDEQKSK